jgi:apolipoprotein N-acyltransferase
MAASVSDPKHEGDREQNRVFPSAQSIQSVGGLVAVVIGVLAITALAVSTMAFIDSGKDANTMIPLSTAAFGVISAIVGAYLGIKIGTDQSKGLADDVSQAHAKLAAVQGFIPPDKQEDAQEAAQHAAEGAPRHGAGS